MNKMHMNRAHMILGIVTVVAALSAGCASTTPAGDQMKQQAASIEDISKQWKKGNDLVAQGEKVKGQGSEQVAAGQKQMTEGDNLVSRGKTLMAESETAFRDTSKSAVR